MNVLGKRLAKGRSTAFALALLMVAAVLVFGWNSVVGTDTPVPTQFERWDDIRPDTTYTLIMLQKKVPTSGVVNTSELSMVPPPESIRKIVIRVSEDCHITSTTEVSDQQTKDVLYRITTTEDENYVEFLDRPGFVVPDDMRIRTLPDRSTDFQRAKCGMNFSEAPDFWSTKVQSLGAVSTGKSSVGGDPATTFVLQTDVDTNESRLAWSRMDGLGSVYQRIIAARSTWVIGDLNGLVLKNETVVVLDDGTEVLLESYEILESKVEEGS